MWLKHLPLARPLGERANAGARFENHVVRSNNGKVVYQPSEMQRGREMLMSDLFFAADRLRWESFFECRELVDDSHWLIRQFGASRCEDRGYFRSEEHTSELQSLMRISYAVFCLKKKTRTD